MKPTPTQRPKKCIPAPRPKKLHLTPPLLTNIDKSEKNRNGKQETISKK